MMLLARLRQHRSLWMLCAALAFGALAVFGARGYIAGQVALERDRLIPRQELVDIVVAKRDLRRGEIVGFESMATRKIPKDYLPGSVVLPDRFDSYIGTRLLAPMRGGEPLVHAAMEGADVTTFSSKVRQGIRALTISVDETNSMSGMMQPGDHIDLQVSIRPPARPGISMAPEMTAPLMQDILVLATGRQVRSAADSGPAPRGFTSITVEVTPDQAQKLIVAQRSGKLTALLRNRDDRRPIAQRPLDIYSLLDLPQQAGTTLLRGGPEIIIGGKGQLQVNPQPGGAAQAMPAAAPGPLVVAPSPSITPGPGPDDLAAPHKPSAPAAAPASPIIEIR